VTNDRAPSYIPQAVGVSRGGDRDVLADGGCGGRLRRGPSVIMPPSFSFSMENPYSIKSSSDE
jgi:hypothetical protein